MPKPLAVATTQVIAQGAVVEVSTDDGTTYTPFPGLEGVPRVGSEGEFVETSDIDQLTKTFTKGLKTPPEWELAYKRIGDSALQDTIRNKALDNDDNIPVKFRITYRSGDIVEVDVILNGHFKDEVAKGNDPEMEAIKGQQTGDPVYSKVA